MMKRETEYYAEFFNRHLEIIKSFPVTAYNPKQATRRALDKFGRDQSQVKRLVIRASDDQAIKAEYEPAN